VKFDVAALLRDDLRREHRVDRAIAREAHEVLDRDLAAEVEDLELLVALEAVVALVALHVEDRVDADRVRVGPDAGAGDAHLAPDALAHERVDLSIDSACASRRRAIVDVDATGVRA
jgi:hypothetical protein